MKSVYLDNGATTKVDKRVVDIMSECYIDNYGNPSSLHSFGRAAKKAVENARQIIANKINSKPEEIIFTSGGTESDNLAIKGVAYSYKNKGNHIITTTIEHPAVYNTFKELEKNGFVITEISVDKDGFVNYDELEKAITPHTILFSMIHGNNEIGTIQNIKKFGELCHSKNVFFHIDAVQSFTKVPIDVVSNNVDLASFSSHKIHGPKGIGALYINSRINLKPLIVGGSHEFKKRAGTENVAGIVGFGKAVELSGSIDFEKMIFLRNKLIDGLTSFTNDSWLNGPIKDRLPNNVNISYKYIEGESILLLLDQKGIAVSTGSACSSNSLKPSHVLLALGLKPEETHGSVRLTLSKYTTENEIDYVIESLKEVVLKLKSMSPMISSQEKRKNYEINVCKTCIRTRC
jgi:cysteine desulfurase